MAKGTAPGGWEVEPIVLDGRPCLRVRRHGYHVAYCANPEEVEALLGAEFKKLTFDEAPH